MRFARPPGRAKRASSGGAHAPPQEDTLRGMAPAQQDSEEQQDSLQCSCTQLVNAYFFVKPEIFHRLSMFLNSRRLSKNWFDGSGDDIAEARKH